jgi:plastocyanin domain-containing protein
MRVWLLVLIVIAACSKKADNPKEVGTTGGTVTAGVRTIEIEASKEGYVPAKIAAKPGEKLKLIFTRRASGGDCMAQLKTPNGKLVELTVDKPYEVEVTAPKDGEVGFACGMDMFTGVIVAEKA